MTTLLALDTATEACSVALLHDGKVLSHYEVIPRLHAQRLLPMIKDLLALAAFAWARGEALPADMAQPVYLRDKVATPKAPQ